MTSSPLVAAHDPAWADAMARLYALALREGWSVAQPRDGRVALSDGGTNSLTVTWYDADVACVEGGQLLSSLLPLTVEDGDPLMDHVVAITRGNAAEGVVLTADGEAWAATATIVEGERQVWRTGVRDATGEVRWRRLPAWARSTTA